jgi:hypothetical protein
MPLLDTLGAALAWASRKLGLDSLDAFPPGHAYARTRWDPACFDIASDLEPDAIERAICDAIVNTPLVFGAIEHPTVRMQRALLGVIEARLKRHPGSAVELIVLLIDAYASGHTQECVPGLRAAIEATDGLDAARRAHAVVAHLGAMPSAFDVIDGAIH